MKVSDGIRLAFILFLPLLASAALGRPPVSGYHLVKSVPIGAAPGDAEYFD